VDQRPDSGDQQHETDRQLVDLHTEVHLQAADRYPGEQVLDDGPGVAVPAEHVGQQRDPDAERRQWRRAAQQVSPRVGPPATDQQYRGAGRGQRDEQPDQMCHRVSL
jgi:hypothetical protein